MAKESYYFPHDYNARNDRKIAALVKDYKAAGYGIFWCTCEMMHEEDGSLEMDDLTFSAIAGDMNEDVSLVKEIIGKCIYNYKLFIKNEAVLEANEAEIKLLSNRVIRNFNGRNAKRTEKAEAGRLGGIKSGESRRRKQNEAPLEATKQRKGKERKGEERKEYKQPNGDFEKNIADSNLFRKPNVPTRDQVWEAFLMSGGTKEMAKSFWEKHESTGWFINGSPIINYVSLAQRFIRNWNENHKKDEPTKTSPSLKYLNQA